MKRISEIISDSFIWGVGITQPKRGEQQRAARYITATLLGIILAAVGVFLLLFRLF